MINKTINMLNKFYFYLKFKFLKRGLLISPLPAFTQFLNQLNDQEPQNEQQLILHPTSSSGAQELETNLDKACKSLDPTINSFTDDFPRYNPNEEIFPKRVVKTLFYNIMQLPSNYLKGVMKEFVNNEIKEKLISSDIIIKDKIPGTLMEQIIDVFQTSSERPFGLLGEMTFNQTYTLLQNFNLGTILNNHEVVLHPGYLISAALVYKLTVNTFAKSVYPISTINTFTTEVAKNNWLKVREKNIRLFMLYYAPLITYSIFKISDNSIFDIIELKVVSQEKDSKVLESILSFFFIKSTRFMSSSTVSSQNKNNTPKFLKYLKYLIILLILIVSVDFNSIVILLSKLTFTKVLLLNIILALTYLIYLIIDLYIFTLFLKGKISIPVYAPLFLWNWFKEKEKISQYKPNEIRAFMDLYVRNIIANIIGLSTLILIYTFFL
nr:hypothetical protein [Ganoderma lingzhi]UDY67787.1 hypothetical protein [Ganoderma lingzhi]UOL49793.1 hypothetical protein [Ganoderma lingzhi]UOL49829.1 hypothetical protein [Ganoderma lingzhi]UOL49869.1 hypothetical protein [Ganoderma lingzhi]